MNDLSSRQLILGNSWAIDRLKDAGNNKFYGVNPVSAGSGSRRSNVRESGSGDLRGSTTHVTNNYFGASPSPDFFWPRSSNQPQTVNHIHNHVYSGSPNNAYQSSGSSSNVNQTDKNRVEEEKEKQESKVENRGLIGLMSGLGSMLFTYVFAGTLAQRWDIQADLQAEKKAVKELKKSSGKEEVEKLIRMSKEKNQSIMKSELRGTTHKLAWQGMLLSSAVGAVAASIMNNPKLLTASAVGALSGAMYAIFRLGLGGVSQKNNEILNKWYSENRKDNKSPDEVKAHSNLIARAKN